MAPKKAKAQKMALTDFFADTTTGSWADDDIVPSAPAAKDPSVPKRGDPGYLDAMPDRSARTFGGGPPQREDVPLPTAPPYTAFVGNLTFETDESELLSFFQDLTPVTARLVKAEGKSKGFGYVEFGSVEQLKEALAKSGAQLGGRTVRISVAEAPSTSRREYAPSAAEEASQWRRTGPLPPRDPAPPSRRGTSYTSSPVEGGADRDWGSARGAKFTPSPQMSAGQFSRETSGPGRMREDMGPSMADEADRWRSNKPLVDVRGPGGQDRQRGGMMSEQSSPGLADTESTWSRGSKLKTPVTEAPTRSATGSPVERDWTRKPAAESQPGSADGESPRLPAAPVERRKLNLAPRSAAPASDPASSPKVTSPTTRSSIFGGAQPIDSAAKEAAAADKLKQQAAERRVAAQKAKEEEERKVKQFAEERERSIKEALAAANGGAPPAPAQERGSGGGRGRGGPPTGPGRRVSHDRPPHITRAPSSQNQTHQNGSHPRHKETPQVDADGFAVATWGRQNKSVAPPITSPTAQPGHPTQRKEVKKGFSFSAAVAQKAFEEDNNGDEGVEEARKGVEQVSV